MPNFLLTKSSVITCPHGGMVGHAPVGPLTELINGELPLLLNDLYFVAGCPLASPGPCIRVMWVSGSPTRRVGGVPVLTNNSVGLCQNPAGAPNGPAVILTYQTRETD